MHLTKLRQRFTRALIFFTAITLTHSASGAISFTDATIESGGFNSGERWGASWGDINSDGRPDLFVNNHRTMPSLYRNNGDGTFTEVAQEVDASDVWINNQLEDLHGATWVDFDNDGDDDLYVSVTVGHDSQFMVNTNGVLTNQTVATGLEGDAESRMPIWLDYSGDGYLDVIDMSTKAVVTLQNPTSGTFSIDTSTGLSCTTRMNYGQITDLNNNGSMEFLCISEGAFPQKIYDTESIPFTDVTYLAPTAYNVNDTAIADFNNDLLPDIVMTRGRLRPNQALIINTHRLEAWLDTSYNKERGFLFESSGIITINLDSRVSKNTTINHIFYGSAGLHPSDINFSLDPANSAVEGLKADKSVWGYYIGYNSTLQKWELIYKPEVNGRVYITIDTAAIVSNLTVTGLRDPDLPMSPQLLLNNPSGLTFDNNTGLNSPVSCVSVAAGDFDNDMDIDLYLVCRGGVENLPNILYENNNDGTFSPVPLAGGAEGIVGAGINSGAGSGESVVTADYNVDGFLDLFITNGLLMRPFGLGGSDQLFRNNGNSNNWIELDFNGSTSNKSGIGAKVYITAGGMTQLREQSGGYHRWSQNHQRIHVGLGSNSTIDNIEIQWPSGQTTQHTNVASNKLYVASENGQLTERILGNPDGPPIQAGDECGAPNYNPAYNRGLYIWKDCSTSVWYLRAPGGGNNEVTRYTGAFTSPDQFTSLTPVNLETNDSVDNTDPNSIVFDLQISNAGEDGFDFSAQSNDICLTLDAPYNHTVYLGAKARSIKSPFNLGTLKNCGSTVSQLSINQIQVDESSSTPATFTVSLDSISTTSVSVNYSTSDITAQAGVDYTSQSGTVTIPAGSLTASIGIPVINDNSPEGDEEFSVTLSNSTGAIIATPNGTALIKDDDTTYNLSINDASTIENNVSVEIEVTLSPASTQLVSVNYSSNDGTALAGSDYTSISGTLSFNAGETSKTITLNLIDDTLSEGPEDLTISLSSPVNATISDSTASVSISDNEVSACGQPSFDAATETGVFVWKDCATSEWTIYTLGGGSSTTVKYKGSISSDQPITNLVGYSIEGSDIYDNLNDSTQLDFLMRMQGAGIDGGQFTIASGASACLEIANAPSSSTVYIGSARTIYSPPINLSTLGSCTVIPDISITDASVSEGTATVDLSVTLSAASTQTVSVNYATSDSTASAGNDYLASSGTLAFNAGETSKIITLSIIDDTASEGPESFSVSLSAPVNSNIVDGTASVSINDNEASACAEPAYDAATENGVFVWQDCTTGQWFIRTLGGGSSSVVTYSGNILSNQPITNLTGYSMENGDTYENSTNSNQLDIVFRMQGAGVDGGQFTIASGASACLKITNAPSGSTVYIGSARTIYSAPINLSTLGSCTVIPDISITDASVSEGTATVDLSVTLSVASTQSVSVNYATSDSTASAGSDYLASSGTLTFNAGETSKIITLSIIDDTASEGSESFTVNLSTPVNANLIDGTGDVSINDNEASACGEPAYDAATENGVFVWQDCTTGQWFIRTLGGGSSTTLKYQGNILSDQAISGLVGFSLEGGDTFENQTDNKQLDYLLRMQGAGVDGGQFSIVPGASACLEITSAPSGSMVYIGSARTAYSAPVDLATLASCAVTPDVSIGDTTISESANTVDIPVTLSVASTQAISISYTTNDNTATAGNDYVATNGTITFNPGEISKVITLNLLDDTMSEAVETFTVTLSTPVNANIADNSAIITINDNDGSPTLSVNNSAADESIGNTSITIDLSIPSSQTVIVDYALSNGTAISGEDYTATSGSVTFNPGETSKTISVSILDDTTPEGDESLTLTLSSAVNAVIGINSAIITIIDNDPAPSVTITDLTVPESVGTASTTISLSHASALTITVDYISASGSATVGEDFTGISGVITFAPGETSASLDIDIIDDTVSEGTEDLQILLSASSNATIIDNSATVTISDDDAAPSITIGDLSTTESAGTANATVTLSTTSALTVSVNYTLNNGTAISGEDYTAASGTVTFNPGETVQTIPVSILNDIIPESSENMSIELSSPSNALINDGTSIVTITDDDSMPTIGITDINVNEDSGSASVTVALSFSSAMTTSVNYATADNTALSGNDYISANGTLTFAPGETSKLITISIVDDAITEITETFLMNLDTPVNATISDNSATITVSDTDAAPTVGINDVTVTEGTSTNFLVTLNTASSMTVSIGYTTYNEPNTSSTIFFDNFESPNGWITNPFGTDTATTGQWEQGNPEGTSYNGVNQQLNNTVSGEKDLVTSSRAGSSVGSNDIDNGVTSMRSPTITLPAGQQITLDFSYYFAHLFNSNTDDFFRVSVIGSGTSVVLEERGAPQDRNAVWKLHTADLSSFAGQTIRILIEAADNGGGSLVEAAVDDLRITAKTTNAEAGSDYTASTGTLTFLPGEVSQQINIPVLNDALNEFAEEFSVILSNPVNATIIDNTGIATIQ